MKPEPELPRLRATPSNSPHIICPPKCLFGTIQRSTIYQNHCLDHYLFQRQADRVFISVSLPVGRTTQKVRDGFARNLADGLGTEQGRTYSTCGVDRDKGQISL